MGSMVEGTKVTDPQNPGRSDRHCDRRWQTWSYAVPRRSRVGFLVEAIFFGVWKKRCWWHKKCKGLQKMVNDGTISHQLDDFALPFTPFHESSPGVDAALQKEAENFSGHNKWGGWSKWIRDVSFFLTCVFFPRKMTHPPSKKQGDVGRAAPRRGGESDCFFSTEGSWKFEKLTPLRMPFGILSRRCGPELGDFFWSHSSSWVRSCLCWTPIFLLTNRFDFNSFFQCQNTSWQP